MSDFGPFDTINQIKAANKAAGQFFFSADTVRGFESRVESDVLWGRYFVTSEATFDGKGRAFTIRCAEDNGHITTVGEFGKYGSIKDAKADVREVAFYRFGYEDGEAGAPCRFHDDDYRWGYEAARRKAIQTTNDDRSNA